MLVTVLALSEHTPLRHLCQDLFFLIFFFWAEDRRTEKCEHNIRQESDLKYVCLRAGLFLCLCVVLFVFILRFVLKSTEMTGGTVLGREMDLSSLLATYCSIPYTSYASLNLTSLQLSEHKGKLWSTRQINIFILHRVQCTQNTESKSLNTFLSPSPSFPFTLHFPLPGTAFLSNTLI